MTDEKIREVLKIYHKRLTEYPVYVGSRREHLLNMIPQMYEFLEEGRREKVFRWLGFIQGGLWALGEYTIAEMKEHNRP